MQENHIKERPQSSESLDDAERLSDSLTSLNCSPISLRATGASDRYVSPTEIQLDLQETYDDKGYCNDEELVSDQECAIRGENFQTFLTTNSNSIQETNGYMKIPIHNKHTYDSDTVSVVSFSMDYSLDFDDSVISSHQGHTKHSPEVGVVPPLCLDSEAARKYSVNSVSDSIPASEGQQPTSPVVVFDFGVSTVNFDEGQDDEDHIPADITLEETTSENTIAFDLPFSAIYLSDDSGDDSDTASLHKQCDYFESNLPHNYSVRNVSGQHSPEYTVEWNVIDVSDQTPTSISDRVYFHKHA